MRRKDPILMEKISRFVSDYYRMEHKTPSVRAIAARLNIGKSTAHNYLVEMNENGMIQYDGRNIESSRIGKASTGYFSAPLIGNIRCGDPEIEESFVEQYVSLPESLFGKGEFYLLRAAGDSMEDAGISEGDLILIRRQETCSIGDIVVALDDENQNTLKRFGGFNENHEAVLEYMNKMVYPEKTIIVKSLVIQGVAKHVISAL